MVDLYYYLGSDRARESVVYLSLVVAKAFATECLRVPYHPSSAVLLVPANRDLPMLSVVPAGVVGADLVVLYSNCHPFLAGRSVEVNTDLPMLSVEQVAVQDADLVVL